MPPHDIFQKSPKVNLSVIMSFDCIRNLEMFELNSKFH